VTGRAIHDIDQETQAAMIPAGYMAKRVSLKPNWLKAIQVVDIYSVSSCVSKDFTEYIKYWKYNGYWPFDSPEIIQSVAKESSVDLEGASLFYYEVYEKEFDGGGWRAFEMEDSFPTNVIPPPRMQLQGFDVVTFSVRTSPECSPLSCNMLAEEVDTNEHCLLASFEKAERALNDGVFRISEPGPYRIFSVHSVLTTDNQKTQSHT
jgi:hypothetical protein